MPISALQLAPLLKAHESDVLADWVLENDDWLLLLDREEPEKTGEKEERCLTAA